MAVEIKLSVTTGLYNGTHKVDKLAQCCYAAYRDDPWCCPVSERLAKQTKRLVLCAVQLLSD